MVVPFSCRSVTEYSCKQLASQMRVWFFFKWEVRFFSDTDLKKKTIQKPLGLCELLLSMELLKFFHKDFKS